MKRRLICLLLLTVFKIVCMENTGENRYLLVDPSQVRVYLTQPVNTTIRPEREDDVVEVFLRSDGGQVPEGDLWTPQQRCCVSCCSWVPAIRRFSAVTVATATNIAVASTKNYHMIDPTVSAVFAGATIHRTLRKVCDVSTLLYHSVPLAILAVGAFAVDKILIDNNCEVQTNMGTVFASAVLLQIIDYLLKKDKQGRFDPEAGSWRVDRRIDRLEDKVCASPNLRIITDVSASIDRSEV